MLILFRNELKIANFTNVSHQQNISVVCCRSPSVQAQRNKFVVSSAEVCYKPDALYKSTFTLLYFTLAYTKRGTHNIQRHSLGMR